jgi:hypothetical protein
MIILVLCNLTTGMVYVAIASTSKYLNVDATKSQDPKHLICLHSTGLVQSSKDKAFYTKIWPHLSRFTHH